MGKDQSQNGYGLGIREIINSIFLSRSTTLEMNSRKLIEHTRNVLQEYESIRLGIQQNGSTRERQLQDPIIVEDMEVLQGYLNYNQV